MTVTPYVTRDSRVVSHGVSRCPDPTRPDPLFRYPSIAVTDGRPDEQRMGRYAAAAGGGLDADE